MITSRMFLAVGLIAASAAVGVVAAVAASQGRRWRPSARVSRAGLLAEIRAVIEDVVAVEVDRGINSVRNELAITRVRDEVGYSAGATVTPIRR